MGVVGQQRHCCGPAAKKEEEEPEQAQLPQLDPLMKRRIATMMGAQLLMSCGYGCIAPVLPGLAVELGIGATGAGALLSAPAIMRLVLNLPAGRLADDPRVGRFPLMVGGCGLMAVAAAGSACTPSIELLLATRLAFGAGSALAVAGTSAYIADISHTIPTYRARLMGIQTTMVNLGWVVGPSSAGWAASLYGPAVGFWLVCGTSAVCMAALATVPPMPRAKGDAAPDRLQPSAGAIKTLLQDPRQQGVMALTAGIWLGISAELSVVLQHAALEWDANPAEVGALLAVGSVCGMFAGPVGGWLADRYGRRAVLLPSMGGAVRSLCALFAVMASEPNAARSHDPTRVRAGGGDGRADARSLLAGLRRPLLRLGVQSLHAHADTPRTSPHDRCFSIFGPTHAELSNSRAGRPSPSTSHRPRKSARRRRRTARPRTSSSSPRR